MPILLSFINTKLMIKEMKKSISILQVLLQNAIGFFKKNRIMMHIHKNKQQNLKMKNTPFNLPPVTVKVANSYSATLKPALLCAVTLK